MMFNYPAVWQINIMSPDSSCFWQNRRSSGVDMTTNEIVVRLIYSGVLLMVGLAMGSFLNVVAYRVPLGMSLLSPPSTCPSCGKAIAARDNIPLFGWLFLGGKCRWCKKPIAWRYPLVELLVGLFWAVEGWRLGGMELGFYTNVFTGLVELAFLFALGVTFLVDWDHKIILDEISLGGLGVALIASALLPNLQFAHMPDIFAQYHAFLDYLLGDAPAWWRALAAALTGGAMGLGFSLLIYFAGNLAFKKQIEEAKKHDPDIDSALGLGDVKLMAFFGAFLGWWSVLVIFIIASLTGALAGSAMKLASGDADGAAGWAGIRNRWQSGDSVVPFGPFLVIGALGAFFFDWGWMLGGLAV